MAYYRILVIAFSFLLLSELVSAQPDWSLVPSDFEFTMTVTGVVVINCVESTDENDIVGAFINGEIRGVQALDTDINGRKFAYMIIYDNDFEGNEITFKIYDASSDSIYDAQQSVIFSENAIIGNSDSPFIFNTNYNLTETFLSQDSIDENALAGSVVAEINSVNELQDTFSIIYDFVDDASGPDNHYFIIEDSLLILTQNVEADLKSSYQIHLSATTLDGCTRDDIITLYVTGQGTVAVNETKNSKQEIRIYPNPASSIINFSTEGQMERIRIYAIDGMLVYDMPKVINSNEIDITFLMTGIYVVEFYLKGIRSYSTLIIN